MLVDINGKEQTQRTDHFHRQGVRIQLENSNLAHGNSDSVMLDCICECNASISNIKSLEIGESRLHNNVKKKRLTHVSK